MSPSVPRTVDATISEREALTAPKVREMGQLYYPRSTRLYFSNTQGGSKTSAIRLTYVRNPVKNSGLIFRGPRGMISCLSVLKILRQVSL